MHENKATFKDALLFSYVVASADMRYIEVTEREIYLRMDPEHGPVVRGEFSGCGSGCFADLNQIFLEYAMSCEGCKDQRRTEEEIVHFGERLGKVLGARLSGQYGDPISAERLSKAFSIVLNSMDVPFVEERSAGNLLYTLEFCPLCASGSKTGMGREMAVARLGFAAFSESLVHTLAPDWRVVSPTVREPVDALLEIKITQSG